MPSAMDDDALAKMGETAHLLLKVAQVQLQVQLQLFREATQVVKLKNNGRLAPPAEPRPRTWHPQNQRHRTWRGFVESMQQLEAAARRADLKPTKAALSQFGSDSAKTITRTMVHYGLAPSDWPPSTWPAEMPPKTGDSLDNVSAHVPPERARVAQH